MLPTLHNCKACLWEDTWLHTHACMHTHSALNREQFVLKLSVQIHLLLGSRYHIHLFATPWTAAHHASLSFTISWSLHKLTSRFTCDASKNAKTQALPHLY